MGLSAISLFSGAGGLDLAAKACGIRTVAYCEWDAYAQGVLMSRMRDRTLDDAPLWDDVTTFDGKDWRGKVDIVFGGFPCQPHSSAGKREGASDSRNLWPDTLRILRESGAWGFIGENVPGILTNGFAAQVMADLEREGFCGAIFSNSACAYGAPHPRERVFFVAHAIGARFQGDRCPESNRGGIIAGKDLPSAWGGLPPQSGILRMAHELAEGPHRVRLCGNGVVPGEAIPAFEKLKEWAGIA